MGRLTLAAYAAGGGTTGEEYSRLLRDARPRFRDATLLVAAADGDGSVLGTVTWCPEGSPWREIARAGEGEMRMLAVDPAAQGRGVGRLLVEACVERDRAGGFATTVLCTLRAAAAARRLYERAGFTRLPERDWSPAPGIELLAYALPR